MTDRILPEYDTVGESELSEIVHQALGAASTAWDPMNCTGVFKSEFVAQLGTEILEAVKRYRFKGLRMPHELKLVRPKGQAYAELYVDGERFPFYTTDGYHVELNRGHISSVTTTLVGESLVVADQWLNPTKEDSE